MSWSKVTLAAPKQRIDCVFLFKFSFLYFGWFTLHLYFWFYLTISNTEYNLACYMRLGYHWLLFSWQRTKQNQTRKKKHTQPNKKKLLYHSAWYYLFIQYKSDTPSLSFDFLYASFFVYERSILQLFRLFKCFKSHFRVHNFSFRARIYTLMWC